MFTAALHLDPHLMRIFCCSRGWEKYALCNIAHWEQHRKVKLVAAKKKACTIVQISQILLDFQMLMGGVCSNTSS